MRNPFAASSPFIVALAGGLVGLLATVLPGAASDRWIQSPVANNCTPASVLLAPPEYQVGLPTSPIAARASLFCAILQDRIATSPDGFTIDFFAPGAAGQFTPANGSESARPGRECTDAEVARFARAAGTRFAFRWSWTAPEPAGPYAMVLRTLDAEGAKETGRVEASGDLAAIDAALSKGLPAMIQGLGVELTPAARAYLETPTFGRGDGARNLFERPGQQGGSGINWSAYREWQSQLPGRDDARLRLAGLRVAFGRGSIEDFIAEFDRPGTFPNPAAAYQVSQYSVVDEVLLSRSLADDLVASFPRVTSIRVEAIRSHLAAGNLDGAARLLASANPPLPKSVTLHEIVGNLARGRAEALRGKREVVALEAKEREEYQRLRAEAMKELRAGLELAPHHPGLVSAYAEEALLQGLDPSEIIGLCEATLRFNPRAEEVMAPMFFASTVLPGREPRATMDLLAKYGPTAMTRSGQHAVATYVLRGWLGEPANWLQAERLLDTDTASVLALSEVLLHAIQEGGYYPYGVNGFRVLLLTGYPPNMWDEMNEGALAAAAEHRKADPEGVARMLGGWGVLAAAGRQLEIAEQVASVLSKMDHPEARRQYDLVQLPLLAAKGDVAGCIAYREAHVADPHEAAFLVALGIGGEAAAAHLLPIAEDAYKKTGSTVAHQHAIFATMALGRDAEACKRTIAEYGKEKALHPRVYSAWEVSRQMTGKTAFWPPRD